MPDKLPNVSVVIPSYNRSKYVTKAIDSALAQTYCDYEIILVDDGSTDNTKAVTYPYLNQIQYIYQEHSRVSAARNTGIKAAKGKWIAFLDSDDEWFPEYLSSQIRYVEQTGVKVCFTDFTFVADQAKCLKESLREKKPAISTRVFYEPLELLLDFPHAYHLQAMLVEREILERVGCFDERLKVCEDFSLFFKLALETPFGFIDEPLMTINRKDDRNGLTTWDYEWTKMTNRALVDICSMAYFRSYTKSRHIVRQLRNRIGGCLRTMAEIHCVEKNSRVSRSCAIDAIYFGGNLRHYILCGLILLFPMYVRWRRGKQWQLLEN